MYFEAGGGHRSAAMALKAVIEGQGRPWEIRLVNLTEILDEIDVFRKITGLRLEDIYNQMLNRGWTLGSAQGLKFVHGMIRLYHRPIVRLLEEFWPESQPDLVVSLVPNFNRAMCQSLGAARPATPYVTILTDFADYPPHFWIERQEQYFICGTDKAVEQARELGHNDAHVFRASGMILRPKFYDDAKLDRAAERTRLGLDPAKPTGIVLFGGQGSKVMLEIARNLPDTQLIFICGKNEGLAAKLRALPAAASRFVEGFTSEVPYYMRLADFFIGKPGPGSISEAVTLGLPVIVERNIFTMPQERYNTEWVREHDVGVVLPGFRGIDAAVREMLGSLDRFRANTARIHNRAVYEIPEILAGLLH
jgi:hypothetical protein